MFEGIWWAFDDFWHLAKPFLGVRTLRLMVPLEAPEWTRLSGLWQVPYLPKTGGAERQIWLPCSCFGATFPRRMMLEKPFQLIRWTDDPPNRVQGKPNKIIYIYKLSWIGVQNPIHLMIYIYINHTHSMVPNFQTASSPTSTMHIKWGCFIFTGEGILKHFCIGCGLCSSNPPDIFGWAPGVYRMPQALKWDRNDRSVPVHFMAFFFGERLSPCLGEKSVTQEQNEIWWDM